MRDVVGRMGGYRPVAARKLMLALRTGFDNAELAIDRKVDGLMVADLEMQEGVILDAAPIAAIKGI